MGRARSARVQRRRRALERRVALLQRHAQPDLTGLVRAWRELAELLLGQGEEREAWIQLDDLVRFLEQREGDEALLLRTRVLVRRIQLRQQDGDGYEAAFSDVDSALAALRGRDEPAVGELGELEVELWTHLGRLLALSRQENAGEALQHALELAEQLETPRAWLLRLRAHRELATARAHASVEAGLEELSRAAARAKGRTLPPADESILTATRAEMLANAGRFEEALALLDRLGPEPADWALAQRASTLELAGDSDGAARAGEALIQRLQARHDPRDPDTAHRLADALLTQARRVDAEPQRAALAERAIRLLEEHAGLTRRGLRLVARAQELLASATSEPDDAHALLVERVHLLEGIARDSPSSRDRVELVRAYLQLGDALFGLRQAREARRAYGWAVDELERWPDDHPFVQDVLPLALNALGHALGADELWLPARRHLDEARRLARARTAPEVVAAHGELLAFRAVAYVNAGDPADAAEGLRQDVAGVLGAVVRGGGARDELIDLAVELTLLRAEILADHLDRAEAAAECYDDVLALREREPAALPAAAVATLLGAKGVVLNDAGDPAGASALLRESIGWFERSDPRDACDLALTRVNLASSLSAQGDPRAALEEIKQAGELLRGLDGAEVDEADEDARPQAIWTSLYMERGEALRHVGHPLLAVDEFSRSVELCRGLLDEEGDGVYEAEQRLPEALLRRARCFIAAGDHAREAETDLREACQRFATLLAGEGRPEHRRRLEEARALRRALTGGGEPS